MKHSRSRYLKVVAFCLLCLLVALFAATWLAGNSLNTPAQQKVGPIPSDLRGKVVRKARL
jgi:hypothetical protein